MSGVNPLQIALAALALVLAADLHAHGGQYRGPGNPQCNQPQNGPPSGGGASSGGDSGSGATGSSAGPSTLGSSAAAGPVSRGVAIDSDLSSWESWWEFQKDPLIRLRDGLRHRAVLPSDAMLGRPGPALPTLEPPTPNDIANSALPALTRALASAEDRDTVTGCMVALAKIGRDPAGTRLHDLFRSRLRSRDQEVRETAALCFGIGRQCRPEDIELLLALLLDQSAGRVACDRSSVDERCRAFAGYALGLCLGELQPPQQKPVVDALLGVLAGPSGTHRNLIVAAIAALAQLGQPTTPAGRALRDGAVDGVRAFYARDLGPGQQLLQAHCPLAIARLLGRDHVWSDRYRELFRRDLERTIDGIGPRKGGRTNNHIAQSLALALGELGLPWSDDEAPGAAIGQLLLRCYHDHKDQQCRYFAMLSLGRVGGAAARRELLREFDRGTRALEQPWNALALASLVADAAAAAQAEGRSPERDREVGARLLAILDEAKNPSVIGATAIALGLCQEREAGDRMRALLTQYRSREDVAGHLAIGLAMLGDRRAVADLRPLLQRSVRQPQLLVQLTTALGRLGDGAVTDELTDLLRQLDGGLARLSAVAAAIGQIGDRRCIEPLIELLENEQVTPLSRAFAAVALGGVCDPDPLPWNARFARALNYRAAVETLTDGAAGILDIL